jgi:hypothetical protein
VLIKLHPFVKVKGILSNNVVSFAWNLLLLLQALDLWYFYFQSWTHKIHLLPLFFHFLLILYSFSINFSNLILSELSLFLYLFLLSNPLFSAQEHMPFYGGFCQEVVREDSYFFSFKTYLSKIGGVWSYFVLL